jgi:outer membrane protein assembly factor BamD (BamD/ComL family)
MLISRMTAAAIMLAAGLTAVCAGAETLRLDAEGSWKEVSGRQENYSLAVSHLKQLVNEGKAKDAREAADRLRSEYPELAGPDFDAFMAAEMLYADGKFVKAVRSYDKFIADYPESRFYDAALDRKFAIGTAYLQGRKRKVLGIFRMKGYAEGTKIMDKISDQAGDAPISLRAMIAVAENLEKRGKYDDAWQRWSEISLRWPTGEPRKMAMLGMARCKHAAYKGPDYDVSNLVSARTYYENYQINYPRAAQEIDIAAKLAQITEQLAYKGYHTGCYYENVGNEQGANLYYQMVIDNWPQTAAADMARAAMDRLSQGGEEDEKWHKKTFEKIEDVLL